MAKYYSKEISKSPRIDILKKALFATKPRIEADRAVLLTESYKATENLPIIERRADAFCHILSPSQFVTMNLLLVQAPFFPEALRPSPNSRSHGLKMNSPPLQRARPILSRFPKKPNPSFPKPTNTGMAKPPSILPHPTWLPKLSKL